MASLTGRRAQLSLPVLSVSVVALAVLVVGRPRPVVGVRVLGGPTDAARIWSFRLEVEERLGDGVRPIAHRPVEVQAQPGGSGPMSFRGTLDDEGAVEIAFAPPRALVGGARLRVFLGVAPVADVRVELSSAKWASGARRRGGWVASRSSDGVVLRAAAERGVFAVPYRDGLWVEAEGAPPGETAFDVTADGADVTRAASPAALGRARFFVVPREHAASASIRSRTKGWPDTRFDLTLAVVPGALHAELRGRELVVQSPIARKRAYVAVVTQAERAFGATVPLTPDPFGGGIGSVALPPLPGLPPDEPLWAVVSSEPGLASAAAVGWPVRWSEQQSEPARTFDVADALLADTGAEAVAREAARCRRVRLLAAAFAGLSLALTGVLVSRAAQMAKLGLLAHLESAGAEEETANRVARSGEGGVLVVVALLCIGLGAVMLAIFAAWQ